MILACLSKSLFFLWCIDSVQSDFEGLFFGSEDDECVAISDMNHFPMDGLTEKKGGEEEKGEKKKGEEKTALHEKNAPATIFFFICFPLVAILYHPRHQKDSFDGRLSQSLSHIARRD